MSAAENKAVFLSYASQDAAAAQRICDALRSAGVEVWFDQSELVGGDVWDAKIRKQIAECALFVPVISAATQARTEGYFRLEWKLAAQRTHMIADDAAFLLPVVIDVTRDAEARVPAEFKSVQWTRFAGAETPVAFCERVKHLLSGSAALQPALDTPERGLKPRATPKMGRTPRAWLGWAVGATTAVALLGTLGWKLLRHDEGSPRPSEAARLSSPPISEGPTAPLTEARKLTLQARALIDDDPLAVRQNYLLAEELCKKAVVLDVSDAEAWATYARVSLAFWDWGYDDTPRRREAARSQSQRAIRLAPDSIEAGLAEAGLTLLSRPPTQPGDEPEPRLRALLRQAPGDKRVYRLLANTLSRVGRAEEASALRLQSAALPGGDSQALSDDASPFTGSVFNHWVSDRMFDRVFAATPTKTAYHARLVMRIHSLGDLEAARTFLATIPEQLMTEDLFAAQAFILWLRLGEPEKALAALSRVPRDFLEERRQKYPRATLEGLAHALAGRSAAATVKWTEALRLVEQRMTTDSNQSVWIFHRALLLALLGKKEAAREQLDAFRQLGAFAEFLGANGGTPVVLLLLGDTEAAIAEFQGQVAQGQRSRMLVVSALRFDPLLKPIRDDPRVQAMIQEGLARLESLRLAAGDAARSSSAAPLPTDSAPAKSAPADKSVAVLAFKNLSGDKARDFFSDGLSEAVADVLGRVPGLKVVASASAFSFKDKSVPAPEIARQLGVTHLVEGTVQEVGQEVRVTAKLIQADGFKVGVPVNARRELKNIFDLYDEVAGLIAKDFSLQLGVSSAASQALVNPEAFELYLRARQGMERRLVAGAGQALANLAQIERWLSRALELEPRLARAHALLADVWIGRLFYPRPSVRVLQDEIHSAEIARIRAKISEALSLEPNSPDAHASLGNLLARLGQHAEAEAAYRRATALNPSYARAHAALGRELSVLVRVDEAEVHSKLATELDPLSPITWALQGYRMLRARRTHDAIRAFDRALSLEPGSLLGIIGKICALFDLGRRDEAVALVQRVPADDARNASVRFYCFARAGLKADAEALYAEYRSGASRDSSFQWVGGLIALGRVDEALALLTRQGFNHSDAGDYVWDTVFEPVRSDPRWVKLMADAGLAEAHARAQAWRAARPAEKPAASQP